MRNFIVEENDLLICTLLVRTDSALATGTIFRPALDSYTAARDATKTDDVPHGSGAPLDGRAWRQHTLPGRAPKITTGGVTAGESIDCPELGDTVD